MKQCDKSDKNKVTYLLRFAFGALLALTALANPPLSLATTINLNILDGAGEGLNDNTAATPVGGNSGTTIGEQRQIVLQFAADLLEKVFDSSVTIIIDAKFDSLTCSASSATLGSAGPNTVHFDGMGPPLPVPVSNTYYVQALANSYQGSDLNAASDISMTFNGDIDNNNSCLNNRNWYYGLDGNVGGQDIDFLSTVLHEMIHGLGFLTIIDVTTGVRFNNRDDIFMLALEDHSLGMTWENLTNGQRQASAIDDPDLHWTGASVQAESTSLSSGINQGHVRMHAPSSLSVGSSVSHFSTTLSPFELMEPTISGSVDTIGLGKAALEDIGWATFSSDDPIIAGIDDTEIANNATAQIDVAIMDNDTALASLVTTASSSNLAIIDSGGLTVIGSGRLRQLEVTPVIATTGTVNITVTVSDGVNSSNTVFTVDVVSNLPPTISIDTPIDGTSFLAAPLDFGASANDNEDGNISSSISWTSSIDGSLGSGASISPSLSDGDHTISASVTDSDSNTENDEINVVVALLEDADGDGLVNSVEIALGTDPFDSDSDDDFLTDFNEVNMDGDPDSYTPGVDSDPNNDDTDGDGQIDGFDLEPLVPGVAEVNVPLLPSWAVLAMLGLLSLIGTTQKIKRHVK